MVYLCPRGSFIVKAYHLKLKISINIYLVAHKKVSVRVLLVIQE